MDLNYLTIKEAHKLLKEGKVTSVELVKASLDRIKEVDPKIKAFTSVFEEEALEQAKKADEKIKHGEMTELTGIPYVTKANYASHNQRTSASSKLLDKFESTYDATIVERLKKAGAILVGKTNCDAYGFGVSTENSGFGPSRNPWDTDKIPGGSSGGGAAAVAAGCVPFGMLEDTGGSIRHPSALCGIAGLRPTYGLLSRYGVFAMACSYDCPGPVARSTEDISLILKHIVGRDPRDSQSVDFNDNFDELLKSLPSNKKVKLGYPKQFHSDDIDPGIQKKFDEAVYKLKEMGFEIEELDMPNLNYAAQIYFVLVPGEISSNMALYDGIRFAKSKEGEIKKYEDVYFETKSRGFEAEVKRRIMVGTYALSRETYKEYYEKAAKIRTLVINDFKKAFTKVDLIISPSSPEVAWPAGTERDPVKDYLADYLSFPASNAGLPALSVPIGFDNNLPVGMQVIAPMLQEKKLLAFASKYQSETDNHKKQPKL